MQEIINLLAERGYSSTNWIHDADINGAWYGKIGSRINIREYCSVFYFVDHGVVEVFEL